MLSIQHADEGRQVLDVQCEVNNWHGERKVSGASAWGLPSLQNCEPRQLRAAIQKAT
jgi:hypothetical protein